MFSFVPSSLESLKVPLYGIGNFGVVLRVPTNSQGVPALKCGIWRWSTSTQCRYDYIVPSTCDSSSVLSNMFKCQNVQSFKIFRKPLVRLVFKGSEEARSE